LGSARIVVQADISVPEYLMTDNHGQIEQANSYNSINGRGRILVVDDEKFNCDIIFGFLMILGVKNRKEMTHFAYNGEQAV